MYQGKMASFIFGWEETKDSVLQPTVATLAELASTCVHIYMPSPAHSHYSVPIK